ncbi:hypothetical protein J6590_045813 [Homalodisca vitripennis]|nr:hypothetical protein J6590_045813 [Homalodisca vitripennis]
MYDPSKIDEENFEPAATEKIARGREMVTKEVVTTDNKNTKRSTVFHEGYVDGKLYLVPDSNLEAMADIVNFKMRPRRSTQYKHQTSYELSEYDHFRGKMDEVIKKLDKIKSASTTNVDQPKHGEESESEEDSEPEVEPKSEKTPKFKKVGKDEYYLRFLISGHFKDGLKPIYIIQEYNGDPDIFKEQKANFFSQKTEGDVDINISGRFYNENILEESNGKPVALKTKPEKIMIDEKTSNVYETFFKQTFSMKTVEILVKGQFIKSKITQKITPYVTLSVIQKSLAQVFTDKEVNTYNNNEVKTILVYEPENNNPFSKVSTDCVSEDEYSTNTKSSISLECSQYERDSRGCTISKSNAKNLSTKRELNKQNEQAITNKPLEMNSLSNKYGMAANINTSKFEKNAQEQGIFNTLKSNVLAKTLFTKKKYNGESLTSSKPKHVHNTEDVHTQKPSDIQTKTK